MNAETIKRKNLGRGLSALLGEDETDYAQLDKLRNLKTVPIEFLHPGRYQPRHRIDQDQIKDLAESIRQKGILQPILVRRHPDEPNAFEIIAGERRWRAAQLANLHEVPVVVKELTDQDAMEIGLVENLQRQDLSPLEEAEGYQRLMDEFSHTQEQLAQAVGKSRSHVANMLRLLGLPVSVKEMLDDGQLTAGHARALLGAAGNVVEMAQHVIKKGLNVRQTEKLVKKKDPGATLHRIAAAVEKDADTLALERDLANILGLKVEIRAHQSGGGALTLHYSTLEQLDDILHRLTHGGQGPDRTVLAPVAAGPLGDDDDGVVDFDGVPSPKPRSESVPTDAFPKPGLAEPAAKRAKPGQAAAPATDWVSEAVKGEIDFTQDD
jgi:ParB family chromosome partitioning protein